MFHLASRFFIAVNSWQKSCTNYDFSLASLLIELLIFLGFFNLWTLQNLPGTSAAKNCQLVHPKLWWALLYLRRAILCIYYQLPCSCLRYLCPLFSPILISKAIYTPKLSKYLKFKSVKSFLFRFPFYDNSEGEKTTNTVIIF
jgi:hypothetical protein